MIENDEKSRDADREKEAFDWKLSIEHKTARKSNEQANEIAHSNNSNSTSHTANISFNYSV